MKLEIDLNKYPIIRNYEVFPTGSSYVETSKGIETESELEQYLEFLDLLPLKEGFGRRAGEKRKEI